MRKSTLSIAGAEFLRRRSALSIERGGNRPVEVIATLFENEDECGLVSALLHVTFGYGCTLLRARTVGAAFDLIVGRKPDLVILGETLPPNVSAVASLAMLTAALAAAPVLVVTSRIDPPSLRLRMEAGASAVIGRDQLDGVSFAEAVARCRLAAAAARPQIAAE